MKPVWTAGVVFLLSLVVPGLDHLWAQPGPEARNLVGDNNHFALALYGRLAGKEGNLFFSPYSISNALAMTYGGARGKTAEEMATTLRFQMVPERLHAAWAELIGDLNKPRKKRGYQLSVANALWGQKDYGFLPDFLKLSRDFYSAGLQEVDFQNASETARKIINAWVEKETQDKIKDLIPPGALQPETRLVLTNAIYFKAAWLTTFPEQATKKTDFTLASGVKVKVPLMQQNEPMNYLETETFQMVELPYEKRDLSMLIFLPKKIDGLGEWEKSLTRARLEEWQAGTKRHRVALSLPKFKITAQFKLKDVLAQMGMPLAFSEKADFSGMSSRDQLFIDQVLHKAFVEVNEKGTEAAAATAVIIGITSIGPTLPEATFRADHPFTFLIRENRTGSILFLGRVANPQ